MVESLTAAAPWLDLDGHAAELAASDDVFDAVIASVTARAVCLGKTMLPDAAHAKAALSEGWIHLPIGQLSDLRGS
jgi:SH3-like domain-containing protein